MKILQLITHWLWCKSYVINLFDPQWILNENLPYLCRIHKVEVTGVSNTRSETRRWPNAGLMLDQHLRRWPNINTASPRIFSWNDTSHELQPRQHPLTPFDGCTRKGFLKVFDFHEKSKSSWTISYGHVLFGRFYQRKTLKYVCG